MQSDPRYVIEKLRIAVGILASGTTRPQQRLYDAYISSLHVLRPCDFPDALKQDSEAIMEALTWVPIDREGEGTSTSTARAMSDYEAKRLANSIVDLFYEMVNPYPEPTASS